MAIQAVTVIRRMRGGAQSRLVCGVDGNLWVVKLQNNPQHLRVLTNEFIATRLAAEVGLSVPETEIIEISRWLHANAIDFEIDFGRGRTERGSPGLHFGSRFVGGNFPGETVDYLPEPQLGEVFNLTEFAGVLALDKWTGNCDGRQSIFSRKPKAKRYKATFIDQGFCFNAGDWTFPDAPLRGVYARNTVYEKVTGWESFDPWLGRLERFDPGVLWGIAKAVPPEWYGDDGEAIEKLCNQLLKRRSRIRELILTFRNSDRNPFPLWIKPTIVTVPNMPPEPLNLSGDQERPIDTGIKSAGR